MPLGLSFGQLVQLGVVYAVAVGMLAVGAQQSYRAWTGRTDDLLVVVEGALAEGPETRRRLWMVGGPLVVAASLALLGGLTWLLLG